MYTIDTSTFWHFIQSFFGLVGGALRLDPTAFRAVQMSPGAGLLTLLILILAGVSVTLGQSVVLLANKVTPRRFVINLLFNGIIFVVSVIIWAAIFTLEPGESGWQDLDDRSGTDWAYRRERVLQ